MYVRLKVVWKNGDGPRKEGENVIVNTDGSISFDVYSKKENMIVNTVCIGHHGLIIPYYTKEGDLFRMKTP